MEQLSLFPEERPVILMSLMEGPYNRMLEGTKKHEFRTRYLKTKSIAYIYISRTIKKIVAKIEFGVPIIGTSEEIARLSDKEKPGNYKYMIEYLKNGIGYAIPVEKITKIENVSLEELKMKFPGFVVPQSYYSLDKKKELLEYLNSKKPIE